jgi:hypothetical protein
MTRVHIHRAIVRATARGQEDQEHLPGLMKIPYQLLTN